MRLNGNKISSVPDEIGSQYGLDQLYLQDNEITSVSEKIYDVGLDLLDLSNNYITRLDKPLKRKGGKIIIDKVKGKK